jgi:hypothetical protein
MCKGKIIEKLLRNSFAYMQILDYLPLFLLVCRFALVKREYCLCAKVFLLNINVAYVQYDVY